MSRRQSAHKGEGTAKRRRHRLTVLSGDARVIAKVWRLQPLYVILLAAHALLWGFVDTLAVYYRTALFNAMDSDVPFWNAARWIVYIAVFYVLLFIPDFLYNLILKPILERRLSTRMRRELYEKAQRMDLACYDDPDFYNQFVWAMRESAPRAIEVLNSVERVLHNLISSAAIVGLLFTLNVWVSIIMLVGNLLGTFVIDSIGNRVWVRVGEECNPLWRREAYIDRVYTLPAYAKELRTGQMSAMMQHDLEQNTGQLLDACRRRGRAITLLYGVGWNLISQGTRYGTILIMIGELASGRMPLGGFAGAVSALWILGATMQSLSDALAELPKHALYLDKYFAFLDHENRMVSGTCPVPPFESLTFENVSFSYESVKTDEETALEERVQAYEKKQGCQNTEGQDKLRTGEVLHDVSLTLRRGEKLAIVGYNGAGKTTLIKLVMRLYDPTSGRILYNGQDIREFDLADYRAHIGAVFQDYCLFAATVAENVMGGRYDASPESEAAVRKALDSASFTERLATLEKGLDTPLTRELDENGVNLSGGEAQKIAIARVFVRPYELIIMDEPSSALDPVAEYELNHSILNAADRQDRTVIFISHRLSTTRFADRILLFADGCLRESGNHDRLMELNGLYAEMFRMQAEKYRRGEEQETA